MAAIVKWMEALYFFLLGQDMNNENNCRAARELKFTGNFLEDMSRTCTFFSLSDAFRLLFVILIICFVSGHIETRYGLVTNECLRKVF